MAGKLQGWVNGQGAHQKKSNLILCETRSGLPRKTAGLKRREGGSDSMRRRNISGHPTLISFCLIPKSK